jgi:hypothetical protein
MQPEIQTQAEAIIYYIQEMDIDMIELILNNTQTINNAQITENFSNGNFVRQLGRVFDIFKSNKNDKLIGYPGFCNSDRCPNSCMGGYSFVGNNSMHRMDIVIEVDNGNVIDIGQCYDFEVFDKEFSNDDYCLLDLYDYNDGIDSNPTDDLSDYF